MTLDDVLTQNLNANQVQFPNTIFEIEGNVESGVHVKVRDKELKSTKMLDSYPESEYFGVFDIYQNPSEPWIYNASGTFFFGKKDLEVHVGNAVLSAAEQFSQKIGGKPNHRFSEGGRYIASSVHVTYVDSAQGVASKVFRDANQYGIIGAVYQKQIDTLRIQDSIRLMPQIEIPLLEIAETP